MHGLRVVFVLSPYQNAFFTEIAGALGGALAEHGVQHVVTAEASTHEVASGDVFVLLPPHEYVVLEGPGFLDDEAVAARTIGLSAEQPSEVHFGQNVEVARRLAATLDFSPTSVAAYRELGIEAHHLAFGHVPAWDRFGAAGPGRTDRSDRSTNVLYLGSNTPRRMGILATAADALAEQSATRLVVSDTAEPNRVDDPSFFVGERKRDLLCDTDVLVNIHRSDEQYFEWLRFSEAAHCGTAVLTETSIETEPFIDGQHFVSFTRDDLGPAVRSLMGDPERRRSIATAAYQRIRETPLAESVTTLIDVAERLVESTPPPTALPRRTRSEPIGRDRTVATIAPAWQEPSGPRALIRARRTPPWEVVAPAGTTLCADVAALVEETGSVPLLSVMASGFDDAGSPMLEGLWPWQPWRLRHGQHLGRVLIVRPELHRAARRWLPDDRFDAAPHVRIQWFAATHGLIGGHVAAPQATLTVPVDPTHGVPLDLAELAQSVLA